MTRLTSYEDALEVLAEYELRDGEDSLALRIASCLVSMGNKFGYRRIEQTLAKRLIEQHELREIGKPSSEVEGVRSDQNLPPLKERHAADVQWLVERLDLDPNYPRVNKAVYWHSGFPWYNPSLIADILQGTGYPWFTARLVKIAQEERLRQ